MYRIKNDFVSACLISSILFFAIVSLGLSLAILPLYVNKVLGYSPFFVGIVVAVESISTLLSRTHSGRFSDNHGPKKGMFLGLFLTFISGFLCYLCFVSLTPSVVTFIVIILSRILMGIGESLIFTCSGTWPIGLVGKAHAGKIMSWVGIAMFLGLAIGNYFGTWSYYNIGIIYSALLMTFLPVIGLFFAIIVRTVKIYPKKNKLSLLFAINRTWKAGLGFALANVGYASTTAFLVLFFIQKGWEKDAAFSLALFGLGYVASRLTLGWMADSSGLKLTLFSLLLESIGLLLIGLSTTPHSAMLGSFLTGFGLSMIYPLLALPALNSMPDENIGLALSTYESCFDIGILLAGFVGGSIISQLGYEAVFIFAFFCCLIAMYFSILAYKQLNRSGKDFLRQ
ncbi:putative transport protein [Xenorhabdus nematophila ATCC 19061]|uniref:Transport protein n=1 Tax=Xenorhabdus nematophila (strain ATCC 19061 / DSM 3370 / CCUG 14189 / LMG 1036 / NCIMB 9965 / AN6) TaxID=406817 RepID=D3VDM1_XENNA|nr:MFS transporter [Xenorhabdus nematophila]CBJ92261.1 putative transport protein [Xenorhabdus nematophila ATCC 19061]CEK25076.1 putative transport protein [Xenorhabdus nematophila AN6/1]